MRYRKLGSSDIEVSELALGCSAIGGLNWVRGQSHGWPEVDEDEIARAVKTGIDGGITHFDLADLYGNGNAERRLARAFTRLGLRGSDFVLSSKVGYLQGSAGHPYEPFHLRHQCEQSLRNLRRDALDLYYLHNADFGPDDRLLEPAAETLEALQREGKIRLKGQSAYSDADFAKTVPVVRPDVLQSRANLLDDRFIRAGTPVADLVARERLSFIAFSPLAVGLLTGRYDPKNPPTFKSGDCRQHSKQFSREYLEQLQTRLDAARARFGDAPRELCAVALRFVLSHPTVAAVLTGFQREAEVRTNLAVAECTLTDADMAFLRETFAGLG
jgi:aryl-alcohol dehydrogenase-like predicted oxidoreductase